MKAEYLIRSGILALALAATSLNPAHSAVPYTASRPDPEFCGTAPADYARRMGEALNLEYRIKTFGRWGIRGYGEPGSNAPVYLHGNTDLVVLLHGFMASPPEMLPLGKVIHESVGASVYIPLIPGFGGNAELSQLYRFSDWREALENDIRWGRHCFDRVYIVGYSVGGGLSAHHALADDVLAIDGQVLLSPFFKGAAWQQTWAGATAAKGFLAVLKSVFRLKKVSLSRVDRISRGKYRDLDVIRDDPETYDQAFSLRAGMNILNLTRELKSIRNKVRSDVPTSVAVSASDQTISWKYALKFSKRHFAELQDTLVLAKGEKAPHEIVVPDESLNKAFDTVAEWVPEQLLLMMER